MSRCYAPVVLLVKLVAGFSGHALRDGAQHSGGLRCCVAGAVVIGVVVVSSLPCCGVIICSRRPRIMLGTGVIACLDEDYLAPSSGRHPASKQAIEKSTLCLSGRRMCCSSLSNTTIQYLTVHCCTS